MQKLKVAFYTLGCKVNQYETNALQAIFEKNDFEVVNFDEYSDVYIVNTCTVTGMSDKKSRQILRRAKRLNPNSILCAIGCYAQTDSNELDSISDVDLIIGNREKKDVFKIVSDRIKNNDDKKIYVSDIMKLACYDDFEETSCPDHIRAELKIQDGCDRFCSYCIIPYARGPVRSRKPESVIHEVKELATKGIKEVVLTGIHISSYGKDFENNIIDIKTPYCYKYGLIDLIEDISKIDGICRIRLGSLEPRIITDSFVDRISKLPKVCNHFHLSLQSGCDDTLKRMNRKYTINEFEESINLLRDKINDVAITTDIIVGFPGETDEEFNETFEELKKINFSKMHVFKYSRRKNTVADKMPNQVDELTKDKRSEILISLSTENEKRFAEHYINKEIEVLFENKNEGHTKNYILCKAVDDNESDLTNVIKTVIPLYYKDEVLYVIIKE
jgi:threonylcarbamoyladenosine tRNA methylthiotransferase MtaB